MLGKFVKPEVLAECLREGGLSTVDYTNAETHVDNSKLVVGFLTRDKVNALLREGDISKHHHITFFKAAKAFSIRAFREYLLKWCPLRDELLSNATWLYFEHNFLF